MNIDHINIKAPGPLLEEVKHFYCDVLGLKQGFRPTFQTPGYWLYAGDQPLIHLMESDSHHANEKQGYFDHFALRSTGLEDLLHRLDTHEIKYKTSFIEDIKLTQVFLKDPAGIRVEIGFLNEKIIGWED